MIPTALNEKSTDRNYAVFWNNVKLIRLVNYIIMPANSNENSARKHLKGQRSSSQMGAFLVNDNLTDKNLIREMWADYFEALGTSSENAHFFDTVARGVQEIFLYCTNDCTGALSQPLEYEKLHVSVPI